MLIMLDGNRSADDCQVNVLRDWCRVAVVLFAAQLYCFVHDEIFIHINLDNLER